MILDDISNYHIYCRHNPRFKRAFEFIIKNKTKNLPDGKYIIDNNNIFALVSLSKGKGLRHSKLENHRKYIDVQFVQEGKEIIGYTPSKYCKNILKKYDKEKDIAFFKDKPLLNLSLPKNYFVIFFPHDAHAPLSGKSPVRKIVIKVAA